MRSNDAIQRIIYYDDTPITEFALKSGVSSTTTLYKAMQNDDCRVSTLYRVARAGGFQLILFNPQKKTTYLINGDKDPLKVKSNEIVTTKYPYHTVKGEFVKDRYTGKKVKKPYKPKKSYKKYYRRQVQFVQVTKEIKSDVDVSSEHEVDG